VLRGLFRLILYAFVAYIIYLLFRFFQALKKVSKSPGHQTRRLSGIMVKDESCNTYLPKEDAIREVIEGKEYFFCSKECRQKFLEEGKRKKSG